MGVRSLSARAAALITVSCFAAGSLIAQTPIKLPTNKYTPEQDVQLGREAAAEIRKQYPIIKDERIQKYLTTLGDRPTSVRAEVDAADQVIMVVGAGGQAEGAEAIGRACSLKRVTTTALIVGAREASEADLSKTLVQLRPWSLMVVIANSDDYVRDMMTALRV